jgi:hypothetical protein
MNFGIDTSFSIMHGLTGGPATMHGFVRSAITLIGIIFAVALVLLPLAMRQTGSSGPAGLGVAAAICLFSGLIAEGVAGSIARTSPLGATLVGMMIRMFVPMGVVVAILATGHSGREYLAFIAYLLAFYMLTLAVETWLAVKRSTAPTLTSNHSAR